MMAEFCMLRIVSQNFDNEILPSTFHWFRAKTLLIPLKNVRVYICLLPISYPYQSCLKRHNSDEL